MDELTAEEKCFLAFSTVPAIGPARLRLLINYFGSAQAAWEAAEEELRKVGLPKDALGEFLPQRAKLNVGKYIQNFRERGIKYFTINDPVYPTLLKNISDPPFVLYIKSELMKEQVSRLVEKKVIAIVGTRRVTAYGREVTESLTGQLAAAGLTIVSGLALGVDGVAHQAAITAGGKTVAVLGAGVEVIYPPAHRDLYGSILSHGGAIVSEVAPEKHVGRGIFPARNRIIAGLSQAVLVTEGAIDSGSLITARAALDYGRPVLAVPGPINSAMAEGTNYLIKQGARLVTSVEDILEELGYKNYNGYKDYKNYKKEPPVGETGEEQKILDLLFAEPREFDDLVRESQIPAGKLGAILAVMEMKKKLKNSGLTYSL